MSDIHELMQQVAELEKAKYRREGDVSILEEPLENNRQQVVYGYLRKTGEEEMGFLVSKIGQFVPRADAANLLKVNYFMEYSKIAITKDNILCIIAFFNLNNAIAEQVIKIIREVARFGDRLEREIYKVDQS